MCVVLKILKIAIALPHLINEALERREVKWPVFTQLAADRTNFDMLTPDTNMLCKCKG